MKNKESAAHHKMKLSRGNLSFRIFNTAVMILLAVVIIYPLYYVVLASFTDPVIVNSGKPLFYVEKLYLKGYETTLHYKPLNPDYDNFGLARVNSTTCRGSMIVLNDYYDKVAGYAFDAVQLLQNQKTNGKDAIMSETTPVPRVLMTTDELSRLAQIQPPISDIVDRYINEWITKGVTDDNWNAYKAELEAAGVNDLVSIYQGAYDRNAK